MNIVFSKKTQTYLLFFLIPVAALSILYIYSTKNILLPSLAISIIDLALIAYALSKKYFQHMIFKIYYAYHIVSLILPPFLAIFLYPTSEVAAFLTKYGVTENDMLKSNTIILFYDFIVISSVVFCNKINFVKKKERKIFKYYLSNGNKYVTIIFIALISYSMKLYLMSINAWYIYDFTDLTKYPLANTANILQKLDVLLLLYIGYNYKYDKSKVMVVLILSILTLSLYFALISTSKAKLFIVLIPIVLLIMQLKHKKIYMVGVFFLFMSSGVIFKYVSYLRVHNTQSLTTNTVGFFSTDRRGSYERDDIFQDAIIVRLGYQFVLARAIKVYDNEGHEYKADYLNNVIGFVPRVLWPGKPIMGINANKIGHDIGALHRYDYVTSVGITPIGEAFYELRYWGILVVPIFVGFILYFFGQVLNENYWIGFMLSIIIGLHIGVSDWYNALLPGLLKNFIIFYFFGLLLNRKVIASKNTPHSQSDR